MACIHLLLEVSYWLSRHVHNSPTLPEVAMIPLSEQYTQRHVTNGTCYARFYPVSKVTQLQQIWY